VWLLTGRRKKKLILIQVPVHPEWAEWIIKFKTQGLTPKAFYKGKTLCNCKGFFLYGVANMYLCKFGGGEIECLMTIWKSISIF